MLPGTACFCWRDIGCVSRSEEHKLQTVASAYNSYNTGAIRSMLVRHLQSVRNESFTYDVDIFLSLIPLVLSPVQYSSSSKQFGNRILD